MGPLLEFLDRFGQIAGLDGARSAKIAPGRVTHDPATPATPPPDPTAPATPPPDPTAPDPVTPPVTPPPVTPPPVTPPAAGPPTVTETLAVAGGRVTHVEVDAARAIASVEITGQPGFGHASVNPDHSISLVLSGESATGRIDLGYTVTYADGTAEAFASGFDVAAPTEAAGWGAGQHYMLETGTDGHVAVETGETHRKVYVGGGDDALSRADIARLEGMKTAQISTKWLIDHPEYGGSEGMALDADAGMDVWYGITSSRAGPSSNWLMLERGHGYDDLGQVVARGATGESELHPMHVTSWGEGAPPVISGQIKIWQEDSECVVISGVTVTGGVLGLKGQDILFDDVTFTGDGDLVFQGVDRVTIRDSSIEDIVRDAPRGGRKAWGDPFGDRISGIYVARSEGLLIEDSLIHHNAWADDYRSPGGGQPPSQFSHNIYLQNRTTDVTVRDNVIAQGASFGAQFRGGAFVEDNAFIDNNAAFNLNGGIYGTDGPIGNFSFVADNLVTSAGYKTAPVIGAVSLGQVNSAYGTTLLDNIVAHLANPDDPAEIALKPYANASARNDLAPFYDDTIVYNWLGSRGGVPPQGAGARGVDGLDLDRLDQTTIQTYAAALLGRPDATIDDLMAYLSAQDSVGPNGPASADDIIRYFQEGFGIAPAADPGGTHRFVPEEMSDGVRWDNRVNWDRDVLPGRGDDVDLGGNRVAFGTLTARVGELDLGPDGGLRATSGRLDAGEGLRTQGAGGTVEVDRAGQVWTEGRMGEGVLHLDVQSGRFANTGDMGGRIDMHVSGDGQAILGTGEGPGGDRFDLGRGSALEIRGDDARVGFDGDAGGTAVLRMGNSATLSFVAEDGGIGHIGEFRSGAFGDAPDVRSGIDLGGGRLHLDLSDGLAAGRYVLLEADEIVGRWGEIEVNGLRDDQDLRFEIDHETDTMTLIFGKAGRGTGQMSLDTLGDMEDARADVDLWAALTDGQGMLDEAPPTGADADDPDDDGTQLTHL